MQYKYSRNQLFGKRLKVPKNIKLAVYNCQLTFNDFIKYDLEDKIPISCLRISDRQIVERFGLEKAKTLDWELINKNPRWYRPIQGDVFTNLMQIDPTTEDINKSLYEGVVDNLKPSEYSSQMKSKYPDRFFDTSHVEDEQSKDIMERFNKGNVPLKEIILNWDLLKDKNLTLCLQEDYGNSSKITDVQLKEFMSFYGGLVDFVLNYSDINIYSFIKEVSSLKIESERREYLEKFVDSILDKTIRKDPYSDTIELSTIQYKELFKYSSIKKYLSKLDSHYGSYYGTKTGKLLSNELEKLPQDYIFNIPIPFNILNKSNVLKFVGTYGLKNIVDFDNECGHFFTKNNCEMLLAMYQVYLLGNSQTEDEYKIHVAISGEYSREDFYEAMRRMIIYVTSDEKHADKISKRQEITGRFRGINHDLFISSKAPEELKEAFYSKSITPQLLAEHKEYIPYLEKVNLASCFKSRDIQVKIKQGTAISNKLISLYDYLCEKTSQSNVLDFIAQYSDVLAIYDEAIKSNSIMNRYISIFNEEDNIAEISKKFCNVIKELIIKNSFKYPNNIPDDFRTFFPDMVLEDSAPEELKTALYNRTINQEFILSNKDYHKYLKNINLEVLYKYMPVTVFKEDRNYGEINLVKAIEEIFGKEDAFDIMLLYGKYIESVFNINKLENFKFNNNSSKEELLKEIDSNILQAIIDGKIKYDDNMPSHFKNSNPTLFLDQKVSKDIRDKFYNREFVLQDFNDTPDLLNIFGDTNIIYGFSEEFVWIAPLFNNSDSSKIANLNRLKIILEYQKINDSSLRLIFKKYILKNIDNIDPEKIKYSSEVLCRLVQSNSSELYSVREKLATQLLKASDPIDKLNKIEKIFIKNNIPLFGKIFSCFQILYPNLEEFQFDDTSRVSPELKEQSLGKVGLGKTSNEKRFNIIFNDLLRIAYRSNSRNFMKYLENIEIGNDIYLRISKNDFDISGLSQAEQEILEIFIKHLQTLLENTIKGSTENIDLDKCTLSEKTKILGNLFGANKKYDLKDRVVRSFCYYAGIKSFDELKTLTINAVAEADARGRKYARELGGGKVFRFEKGDFVRGIGGYEVLGNSLNTGNVSKEFLSVFRGTSSSDTTPLDVDITMIDETSNIYNSINGTPTGFGFGNVFVIFKKDNPNFYITRDKDGNLTNQEYDPRKNELFGTSVAGAGYETHWGARTGFAFTDVDFILYKKQQMIDEKNPYDENGNVNYKKTETAIFDDLPAIKFEIARNGYYIPVIDFSGKLIFTEKEYDELRRKMAGLSYYGLPKYNLSNHLVDDTILEIKEEMVATQDRTTTENMKIQTKIIETLTNLGIRVNLGFNPDLTNNNAELYCTGSTSRNTNIPNDSDFDFLIKIDRDIYYDDRKLTDLKATLKSAMGLKDGKDGKIVGQYFNGDGNAVDVEISFVPRTDKLDYSTDVSLQERLKNIEEQYPDQYPYVVANIVFAKKILKENGVYKTAKSDIKQGGMGGIGIENWILQHGGSLFDAAKSFLEAADGKTFEEFVKIYQVWDFGSNHYSEKTSMYSHENFIFEQANDDNKKPLKMTEDGYNKMVQVLRNYINNYKNPKTTSIKR